MPWSRDNVKSTISGLHLFPQTKVMFLTYTLWKPLPSHSDARWFCHDSVQSSRYGRIKAQRLFQQSIKVWKLVNVLESDARIFAECTSKFH